jgi:hypothetical protein
MTYSLIERKEIPLGTIYRTTVPAMPPGKHEVVFKG